MANGRTDAEDMERQYQLAALRDTFAAAALTGYNANPAWDDVPASIVAEQAYGDADAMLCERERHHIPEAGNMVQNTTNHDAVPEARARDADRARTDKATTRPGDGTGNTPTLSESEREAIEQMLDEVSGKASAESWVPAILRNLLARLARTADGERRGEGKTRAAQAAARIKHLLLAMQQQRQ
jgi:hypothetical protein